MLLCLFFFIHRVQSTSEVLNWIFRFSNQFLWFVCADPTSSALVPSLWYPTLLLIFWCGDQFARTEQLLDERGWLQTPLRRLRSAWGPEFPSISTAATHSTQFWGKVRTRFEPWGAETGNFQNGIQFPHFPHGWLVLGIGYLSRRCKKNWKWDTQSPAHQVSTAHAAGFSLFVLIYHFQQSQRSCLVCLQGRIELYKISSD